LNNTANGFHMNNKSQSVSKLCLLFWLRLFGFVGFVGFFFQII